MGTFRNPARIVNCGSITSRIGIIWQKMHSEWRLSPKESPSSCLSSLVAWWYALERILCMDITFVDQSSSLGNGSGRVGRLRGSMGTDIGEGKGQMWLTTAMSRELFCSSAINLFLPWQLPMFVVNTTQSSTWMTVPWYLRLAILVQMGKSIFTAYALSC